MTVPTTAETCRQPVRQIACRNNLPLSSPVVPPRNGDSRVFERMLATGGVSSLKQRFGDLRFLLAAPGSFLIRL